MLPNEKEKRPIGLTALSALEREGVNCLKALRCPLAEEAELLKLPKLAIFEHRTGEKKIE